jgi:hypothetical protein
LTDADSLIQAITRLTILERLWGKDREYMADHDEEYRAVVREQLLIKASSLISLGRTEEARQTLGQVTGAPIHFAFLAALPGPIARELLSLRRALRGIMWRIIGKSESV